MDHLHIADDELYDKIENNQYVSEIESKVQRWAKRKTKEISVLKANEKYRKEFLGNVSHELKTPIFNIQGYILTLIDGGLHDEEINMKYLIRAEKNINRLISIVKDLETISKLESGALKLHFENFNIINQIEEVIEMHEMLAKDHRIQLFFNQKPKGKLLVRADKKRIFEVISNLIINSILYGKNGGTTTIELTEKDDIVIVEVRDDGVGIDKKHLIRIFERFYRIDKSRSREIGGTGLGLSIVKHIIEAHRQKIKVTSKLEIGSTFAFSLKKSNHPQQLFEN